MDAARLESAEDWRWADLPEQVVHDRYRALHIDVLKQHVDEGWLVHMLMPQLRKIKDAEACNGTLLD